MQQYDSTADTLKHIKRVSQLLNLAAIDLINRGNIHDNSKLLPPEKNEFDRLTPILKDLEFGSEEYKDSLKELEFALQHHYDNNTHHPQHYGERGINGMNLFDIMEMLLDWKAATERTKNGNIKHSLHINSDRFQIDEQLSDILMNTINYLGWRE